MPTSLALTQSLIRGKHGIEIGGPSSIFQEWYSLSREGVTLPIYGHLNRLDNCDFSKSTTWASHHDEYRFQRWKPPGKNYFCEGSDLSAIEAKTYDFLLSSHNLEHFANPVKALKEWQRVVMTGGTLILVLPHRLRTFDLGREATTVKHMFDDFLQDTQEDDQTHAEEIVEARKRRGVYDDTLEEVIRTNLNHRKVHHHTFDEENSRALLEAVGLKVLSVELLDPFHLVLVARFPK